MGLKLKLKRIEKGFKQGELAEKVGISRYYLSALENGRAKNPSILVMKKISEILETSVEELFFNE
ncbi:helix-turn-helix transcriptional regulator [Haloimpatiens massiliensis]|uniref:helix-turn-helix transcriptional regulator n=1 Tax=Haloimpatiens massiliensis TaxID=1658110 RepID=UPI000C85C35E|nr:helix-turn-helix transcriptional regulator [Haloimpatiens massiliensis]